MTVRSFRLLVSSVQPYRKHVCCTSVGTRRGRRVLLVQKQRRVAWQVPGLLASLLEVSEHTSLSIKCECTYGMCAAPHGTTTDLCGNLCRADLTE
jgi:hypothetical protein